MKPKHFSILLVLFLLLPVVADAAVARNVSPEEAYRLIDQTENLFLLDVRTPGEYQQARLEGAKLIPIDQLIKRLPELPTDRPILVSWSIVRSVHGVPRLLTIFPVAVILRYTISMAVFMPGPRKVIRSCRVGHKWALPR